MVVKLRSVAVLRAVAVLTLISSCAILFDMSKQLHGCEQSQQSQQSRQSQQSQQSQQSIKGTGYVPPLAVNKTVSSKIQHLPKITDAISQAALDALDEEHQWKKHVTFMAIGAQKAGTTSFHFYLQQHSMLRDNRKECGCFNTKWNESDKDCEQCLRIREEDDSADFIVGDFSPGYIFYTERAIPRIATAYPWVKIFACFRQPVDRVYSQYRMNVHYKRVRNSFKEYILQDLNLLYVAGMLPHWNIPKEKHRRRGIPFKVWQNSTCDEGVFESFFGSNRMEDAWSRYHEDRLLGAVGQGLYAVGVHRWFSVFPRDRFLFLNTNDMATHDGANEVMSQVHRFLGIPVEKVTNFTLTNTGGYDESMDDSMRQLLERIYEPFTRKLEEMLNQSLPHLHPQTRQDVTEMTKQRQNNGNTTTKQWQNNDKTTAKQWQHNDKTMAKQWQKNGKRMAKQRRNNGKTTTKQWQNNDKTTTKQWQSNGKTTTKQWLKQRRNNGSKTMPDR